MLIIQAFYLMDFDFIIFNLKMTTTTAYLISEEESRERGFLNLYVSNHL